MSPALGRFCPTPTSANTFCFSHVGATCFRAQRNGFKRGYFPCREPGIFPQPARATRRCAAARGKWLRATRAKGGRGVGAARDGPTSLAAGEGAAGSGPRAAAAAATAGCGPGAAPPDVPGPESGGRRRGERAPFAAPGTAAVARRLRGAGDGHKGGPGSWRRGPGLGAAAGALAPRLHGRPAQSACEPGRGCGTMALPSLPAQRPLPSAAPARRRRRKARRCAEPPGGGEKAARKMCPACLEAWGCADSGHWLCGWRGKGARPAKLLDLPLFGLVGVTLTRFRLFVLAGLSQK